MGSNSMDVVRPAFRCAYHLERGLGKQFSQVRIHVADVRHVAVNGDVAFAERVDHLKRADGSLIFSLPVTGVFEFDRDGRIAVWREYFDSAPIMKVIAAASET